MWSYSQWVRQLYLACVPAYPIGYLVVHGFRDDIFFTKLYVKRSEIKPSDHLKEIVESEFDRVEDIFHPQIRISLTDATEPRVYGGFFLKYGAEIQFPLAASFEHIEYAQRLGGHIEMDFGRARNRRKLEASSDIAEEMLTRMMLSEKAKRFIVQRELQHANDGFLFSLPMLGWAVLCSSGYPVLIGLSRFIGSTAAAIGSLVFTTSIFRAFLKKIDAFTTQKLDEVTVQLGADYEEGARDYFANQMAVNRLLRKVMGPEGESRILKNGDIVSDPLPYSKRLRHLDLLKRQRNPTEDLNQDKLVQ